MEFHEKLQQLRKQNHLTQEQLAEQLFVSRTAISKWESGRGYPNLDSLKCISKLFSISIDELLSNDELIELAETENHANIKKMSGLIFGVLDVLAIALLFLPMFGHREGAQVYAVTLWGYHGVSSALRVVYVVLLTLLPLLGAAELILRKQEHERGVRLCKPCSIALHACAILLFALSRQPYMTAFLFLLFVVKVVLLMQENQKI